MGKSKNRWEGFSDEEVYMLKRSLMEASWNIHMENPKKYHESQKKIHTDLMNELSSEDSTRLYAATLGEN
jgi:hypothetical protein